MKQSSHKLLHVTVLVTGWRKWGKVWKNIQTSGQELSTGPTEYKIGDITTQL